MRRPLRPLATLAMLALIGVIGAGCSNAPASTGSSSGVVAAAATRRRVGWGLRDLGTARVPSKGGLAWCTQNGK